MSQLGNTLRSKWVLAALATVGIASLLINCAFVIIFGLFFHGSRGTLTTTKPIEEGTHLSFPRNTRVLGGSYDFSPTVIFVVAKVAMPKASAEAFFRNGGFEPFTQENMSGLLADEMKRRGWYLGKPQNTLYTVKTFPGEGASANVYCALDVSDSQTTVVYIYRFD